jgi:predicted flap endonuclease-1-like 5' DNA nuclease
MTKIIEVEGIGEGFAAKLEAAGVTTAEGLLEKGASRKGREELVEKTGISDKLILKWVNHADLFRIKGVGSEYAELLEAAGVDSVPELAQRKAENLTEKMAEINAAKKLVRRVPVVSQVTDWVEQAKNMPRVVTH